MLYMRVYDIYLIIVYHFMWILLFDILLLYSKYILLWASLVAQLVKNPPAMQAGKISWRRGRPLTPVLLGFPGGLAGKESTCNAGHMGSILGFGKIPWRRAWPLIICTIYPFGIHSKMLFTIAHIICGRKCKISSDNLFMRNQFSSNVQFREK